MALPQAELLASEVGDGKACDAAEQAGSLGGLAPSPMSKWKP